MTTLKRGRQSPDNLGRLQYGGLLSALDIAKASRPPDPDASPAQERARKLYAEMTFAIVKDNAGSEVLGAVAMARDVTDRVERERAASRSS
jgi:hypothetical protein